VNLTFVTIKGRLSGGVVKCAKLIYSKRLSF